MDESIIVILSVLLGLASGFISGLATGGGMVSIPALMFMGLSPSTAIATTSLVGVSSLTSAFKYHKSKLIQDRRILPLVLLAFAGGIIGSKLLLSVDEQLMQKTFGVICLVLAAVIAFSNGTRRQAGTKFHNLMGMVLLLLSSVFASVFGTGGGLFTVIILSYFYGMSMLEANASSKFITLGGVLSSILIFTYAGAIDYRVGVPLLFGSAAGGYIGAHTAIKKGDARVKTIFLLIVLVSGIKLILT